MFYLSVALFRKIALFMPPNSKKLTGHIGFGLSVRTYVRACVRACVRSSRTVYARVLKFHIWISHGKIADTRFFLPFWCYAPLKKSE